MPTRITWKENADLAQPLTLDDKIRIFRDQTWGWQIHVAEMMINGGKDQDGIEEVKPTPHAGYAVLSILLSYFEMIAQYELGESSDKKSKDFFFIGLGIVFPQLAHLPAAATDDFKQKFYKGARCGLYHSALAKGIGIAGGDMDAIVFGGDPFQIWVNPHRLPSALAGHLAHYVKRLQDPAEAVLRTNFEKMFDESRK